MPRSGASGNSNIDSGYPNGNNDNLNGDSNMEEAAISKFLILL